MMFLMVALIVWIALWGLNLFLVRRLPGSQARLFVPIVFGLTLAILLELVLRGLKVPFVILPKPSEMVARLFSSLPRELSGDSCIRYEESVANKRYRSRPDHGMPSTARF